MSLLFFVDNSINSLCAKCDNDGNITYKNELFKTSFSHIKPTKFKHLVSDSEDLDEVEAAFKWAAKNNNRPKVFNVRTIQRNGVYRWVVWEIAYLSGEFYLMGGLLYDVVSKTSQQYEKLKKQVEDITSFVSHEFRQPLSSIVGINKLLQQLDPKKDAAEHSKLLKMLNESTAQLDDVFLRAIERGEIGKNTR